MSNLSISNIGWAAQDDERVYGIIKELGFKGVEIAPTRIFNEAPYDKTAQAREWAQGLYEAQNFVVPSMQSIWYGRTENIFTSSQEREALREYTEKAVDFAEAIGCHNLVFGCPRNRNLPEGTDPATALEFFREIGAYALKHNTVIGMEANPPIYNTNYINNTSQALELIKSVNCDGFKLNLDLGTMIYNDEDISVLEGNAQLINHVHISEPGLKLIEKRDIHKRLAAFLKENDYQGFVSIEMGRQDNIEAISKTCSYIKEIFA